MKTKLEDSTIDQKHLSSPVKTRKKLGTTSTTTSQCFFCNQQWGVLHKAETMTLDTKVKAAVTLLQDRK